MSASLAQLLIDAAEAHGERPALKLDDTVLDWNRSDATDDVMQDGWFHTGDMATVDEDGYFFIVDRQKDSKIWFPDELPTGPTGKILKREIEVPESVTS